MFHFVVHQIILVLEGYWVKKRVIFIFLCLLLGVLLSVSALAAGRYVVNAGNAAVDSYGVSPDAGNGAYIDWSQKIIIAKGIGVAADGTTHPALIKAQALTAAKVVAQRNLLEAVQGAHVVSATAVENNKLLTDMIGTAVKGVLQGAIEIDRQEVGYGAWEVTLALPMYPNVSKAALGQLMKNTPQQKRPAPSAGYKAGGEGNFTGLVVDVSGLGLSRSFTPVIYDDSGRIIYGHMNISQEQAESSGIVDYAATDEDRARVSGGTSKAGNSPLVIKAFALRDNNNNVVVSRSDADMLLALNEKNNDFLSQCKVVLQQ